MKIQWKIRVSIVATSLKGSTITPEIKPVFNVVNGSNGRNNFNDNLFSKSNIEKNELIQDVNALKLDESYEIKNSEEQASLIDSFESDEERKILDQSSTRSRDIDELPSGVSIESASYMENNSFTSDTSKEYKEIVNSHDESAEEENTPKLFSDEQSQKDIEVMDEKENLNSEELFDQDAKEDEDFEIPAFLRRQKF